MEWLDAVFKLLLVGGAVVVILYDGKRSRTEIKSVRDDLGKELTKLRELVAALRLELKDCVKWGDLDRELGPLRGEVKIHGEQIADMKARCSERHRAA